MSNSAPPWPDAFPRIPPEPWTEAPPTARGRGYDAMERHRWYANLDRTVAAVAGAVAPGQVVVDYSAGTAILARRLLPRLPADVRYVLVDVEPDFLRVALDRVGGDPRTAFRLLGPVDDVHPLDTLLAPLGRPVDVLVTTNAIHLYANLPDTLRGWRRAMSPTGLVHAQSGEIDNPQAQGERWLITDFVAVVRAAAVEVVRDEPAFARHRPRLEDASWMAEWEAVYRGIFQRPRPLSHFIEAFGAAGFDVLDAACAPVDVGVDEWLQAAKVYSDLVGWVGESLEDRHELLDAAAARAFAGREVIPGCWTYLTCAAAGP